MCESFCVQKLLYVKNSAVKRFLCAKTSLCTSFGMHKGVCVCEREYTFPMQCKKNLGVEASLRVKTSLCVEELRRRSRKRLKELRRGWQ